MQDALELVRQFHEKMGVSIGDPRKPDLERDQDLRLDLIEEEYGELVAAVAGFRIEPNPEHDPNDPESPIMELVRMDSDEEQRLAVADALGDLAYVICGAALTWGIPLGEVFEEIHRSNMTKTPGNVRADGKILKGPDFKAPDLAEAWRKANEFEDLIDKMETEIPEEAEETEDEEPTLSCCPEGDRFAEETGGHPGDHPGRCVDPDDDSTSTSEA